MDVGAPEGSVLRALSGWFYQARIARGLSQEALALRAGIAVPTYGRIERSAVGSASKGRVSAETLIRIMLAIHPAREELDLLFSLILDATVAANPSGFVE